MMQGFAEHTLDGTDAHLMLAGPNVTAVTDDPRAPRSSTRSTRRGASCPTRNARVHFSCLPMADIDENAAIVNALQRHSTVSSRRASRRASG